MMGPSESRPVLTRLCVFLGAATLILAVAVPWMNLRILSFSLPVPGLFWHGLPLALLGLLLAIFTALNSERLLPWCLLTIALVSRWMWLDHQEITLRGDYWVAQLQLKLSPLNSVLSQLNVAPIELYQKTLPAEKLAWGFWFVLASLLWLGLGSCLRIWGQRQLGQNWLAILLGQCGCRQCGGRLKSWMNFCPQCGCGQGGPNCSNCGQAHSEIDKFCFRCGHHFSGKASM